MKKLLIALLFLVPLAGYCMLWPVTGSVHTVELTIACDTADGMNALNTGYDFWVPFKCKEITVGCDPRYSGQSLLVRWSTNQLVFVGAGTTGGVAIAVASTNFSPQIPLVDRTLTIKNENASPITRVFIQGAATNQHFIFLGKESI